MTESADYSILIVEDERLVARDIQQTVQELGYDAFAIAASADEALAVASTRRPDLVLMDIRIKGERDGIEAAVLMKEKFDVPVVYLTAHADEGTLERAKKTEPYGYLLKPIRPSELRTMIEVSLYKHEMEGRLRERERWFSTTLRSIADAVITVDPTGAVTFMNPAAESLTGAIAHDALGAPIQDVLRISGENGSGDQSPVLQALREGRAVQLLEANLLNVSSGQSRIINDSAAPVVDERADQTLGAVMVFRDVTEQKKLQGQLELANRLTSLGTMAAGVAHEINNPLAVIVANASFMAQAVLELKTSTTAAGDDPLAPGQDIDELSEALADVQSAADRIGRIVSDLQVFSRPTSPDIARIDIVQCAD